MEITANTRLGQLIDATLREACTGSELVLPNITIGTLQKTVEGWTNFITTAITRRGGRLADASDFTNTSEAQLWLLISQSMMAASALHSDDKIGILAEIANAAHRHLLKMGHREGLSIPQRAALVMRMAELVAQRAPEGKLGALGDFVFQSATRHITTHAPRSARSKGRRQQFLRSVFEQCLNFEALNSTDQESTTDIVASLMTAELRHSRCRHKDETTRHYRRDIEYFFKLTT